MKIFKHGIIGMTGSLLLLALLAGCAPEVGTPAWCKSMDAKPKGDWSANEASEYAKSCIFK